MRNKLNLDYFLGDYYQNLVDFLEEKNYEIIEEENKAYADQIGEGEKRIISIIEFNNSDKIKIIWSYENYN